MYVLAADIAIVPDRVDDFRQLIDWQAERSVAEEAGCLRFEVSQRVDDPGRFFLYEVYADAASFEVHTGLDRFAAFREKAGPMMAGEPALTFYNRCAAYPA